jgi:hypothetical protein
VIEEFRRHRAPLYGTNLAYLYCSGVGGLGEATTVVSAENSLIRQLSEVTGENKLVEPVADLYGRLSRDRREAAKLASEERRMLLSEIFKVGRDTRIIIDALDECGKWWDLLRTLKIAADSHPRNLKLFVTSRFDVDVMDYFPQGVSKVLVEHLTRDDMEEFIRAEVFAKEQHGRLLNGAHPKIEEDLVEVLLDKSQGMYVSCFSWSSNAHSLTLYT